MTGEQEEFVQRLKEKKWPIFNRTNNRNRLKIGDSVIFYMGGKKGHKFLGTASVSSQLIKTGETSAWVELANAKVWKIPVSIENIIGDLEFIKNKMNWGCYLQGGVVQLKEKDFEKIISYFKKSNLL